LFAAIHEKIDLEEAVGIEKHSTNGENWQNLFELLQAFRWKCSNFVECNGGQNLANLESDGK
jgi:hypothetical protein